jgi:transcriptional regulator with XRE-family HTH domain
MNAIAVLPDPFARPSSVGRLLRRLRLAAGLSQEDAGIAIDVTIARLKDLESGRASLGYLEGLRLAKAYLLCPTCFRRTFEAALERDGLVPPRLGEG